MYILACKISDSHTEEFQSPDPLGIMALRSGPSTPQSFVLQNIFGLTPLVKDCDGVMLLDKPSAPRGPLEVSDVTRSSMTLSWLAPLSDGGAAVVAYVIERREHMSPSWTRVARVKPQTTVYTVNNLAERTDYQFRVYAENVEGAGPPLTLDVPVSPRRPAGEFQPLLNNAKNPLHRFPRSKSVTSWRGRNSVVSVIINKPIVYRLR